MGTAKYIGRVGALAVALGIGTAVSAMPWAAVAETSGDSSSVSDSSSSTSSATESGGTDDSKPPASEDSSDDTSAAAANEDVADSADDPAEPIDEEPADAESTTAPEPSTPEHSVDTESPSAAAETVASVERSDTDGPPDAMTVTAPEAAKYGDSDAQAADTAEHSAADQLEQEPVDAVVSLLRSTAVPGVTTETVAAEVVPAASAVPANPVSRVVSGVLSWLGLNPLLTGGPTAPVESPLQWGLLEWVRRQIQHTFFNRTPTVAYNPADNSQTVEGVITGNLHAVDPDGDPLTFTVTRSPEHGSLVVNRDGTFTYTPDADFDRFGTDTFTITIDDGVAYRLPGPAGMIQSALHRFAQVIGLSGPDAIDTHPTVKAMPTVVDTIEVGASPRNVAVSPDGNTLYVTNNNGDTVSVIDTMTNTVIDTIAVGDDPLGVVVNPDGAHAYVVNANDGTVSVIDTATNTVATTITVGVGPREVAVSPDGATAYVTNGNVGTVSVIDTATNMVTATIVVGEAPRGVAVSSDGATAYVTNNTDGTVSVIDTGTKMVTATIDVGDGPISVLVSPDGATVYVADAGGGTVSVIDSATNTVTTTLNVLAGAMVISPDGAAIYVTNPLDDTMSVIDTSTNTVTATITVGDQPWDVAVRPDGERAYVANNDDDTVSVIRL